MQQEKNHALAVNINEVVVVVVVVVVEDRG